MKYISIIILLLFIPMLPDLIGSAVFFEKKVGVYPELFIFISLGIFLITRCYMNFRFSGIVLKLLLFLFFLTLGLSALLTIVNFATSTNFVYSLTRINYSEKLTFFSLSLGILAIGSFDNFFFRKNYKNLHLILPVFILILGILMWMWPFDKMYFITKEDSFIEYFQFSTLVIASIYSFLLSFKLFKKWRFLALLYLLLALFLFIIAGEEISWGQRLLGISTPENIKQINTQGEISLHNLNAVNGYVSIAYVLLGIYGSFFSLLMHKLKNFKLSSLILPPPHLFFYFFIPAFISFLSLIKGNNLKGFVELSELILYLGIAVFILELYSKTFQNKLSFDKKN